MDPERRAGVTISSPLDAYRQRLLDLDPVHHARLLSAPSDGGSHGVQVAC